MVDWIAVLRVAANRLASVGAESAASAGVALLHALDAASDELERQRDAAQGNGEEGRTGAVSPAPLTTAAAADRSAPSPAPIDASTHWFGCGIDGGRRHYECLVGEYEDLRARLAEREAELAALRSCERERLIAEVAENASAMLSGFFPYPLVAAANRLANHESARRAKETT